MVRIANAFCLATAAIVCLGLGANAQQSPTDRAIKSLQARAAMYAGDASGYEKLGAAYIQKGRETGDGSYYELARQALSKSLDLLSNDPRAAAALTDMALVLMAEHQFNEALTWAEDALELGAGDPRPWGIVGDALADMGEYQRAEAAYAKLRDAMNPRQESGAIVSARASRVSYLRFLAGDLPAAVQLMQQSIRAALAVHLPAENIAWEYYQLGDELFRAGQITEADAAFRQALAASPQNYRCLAGLAQVRAAQQRFTDAVELYQKALAVVPFPDYAAALGDIYTRMGNIGVARKQYELVEFIAYLSSVNKVLYNRELALYYADHNIKLKESLHLARRELEVRHDIYTWDTLAWSLYKNDRGSEAIEAIGKALRPGTRDALLFFHAGMIYTRAGDARGRHYLEDALSTNPHFHPLYADEARIVLSGHLKSAEYHGGPEPMRATQSKAVRIRLASSQMDH